MNHVLEFAGSMIIFGFSYISSVVGIKQPFTPNTKPLDHLNSF